MSKSGRRGSGCGAVRQTPGSRGETGPRVRGNGGELGWLFPKRAAAAPSDVPTLSISCSWPAARFNDFVLGLGQRGDGADHGCRRAATAEHVGDALPAGEISPGRCGRRGLAALLGGARTRGARSNAGARSAGRLLRRRASVAGRRLPAAPVRQRAPLRDRYRELPAHCPHRESVQRYRRLPARGTRAAAGIRRSKAMRAARRTPTCRVALTNAR